MEPPPRPPRPPPDVNASSLTSDIQRTVAASAKMHIRMLQGELQFLQEVGRLDTEIMEMMSALTEIVPANSGVQNSLVPAMYPHNPACQLEGKIHTSPPLYRSKDRHEGELRTRRGDPIAVCFWRDNQRMAMGWNLRDYSAGHIPASMLEKMEYARGSPRVDIVLAVHEELNGERGSLSWRKGDHLMVHIFHSKNARLRGVGLNIDTMQVGDFSIFSDKLKAIDGA